jgi:hypothetical protein
MTPEFVAIVAAIVAGVFALIAARTTATNQRIVELEKRLATSRLEIYKPLIDAMAAFLVPGKVSDQEKARRQTAFMEATKTFATWIQVYGSDESVRVYHRLMQASYADAPPNIIFRLYGQLILAARRDLGDASTRVDLADLLGIRIKDFYDGDMAADLRLSDDEFYRKHEWIPPWKKQHSATT